jgi:hypothetical protein
MTSITPPSYDTATASAMILITLLVCMAWLRQFVQHLKPLTVIATGLGLLGLIALSFVGDKLGWFHRLDSFPPPYVLIALASLATSVALALSPVGGQLMRAVSYKALVALQMFRLPLELLMLRAALLHIMPVEFSMLGYNADVLSGGGALALWAYMQITGKQPLFAVQAWNALGIACLVAIGALAVLTSPFVHAFGSEPQHINTWILFFPYSLLPLVLLNSAIAGHILLTRKLFDKATEDTL